MYEKQKILSRIFQEAFLGDKIINLEYHQQASAKIIEGLAEKYEKQKTN